MSLGPRIRKIRHENNLTQLEFGKLLNLSESTISLYESGKRQPEYDILLKISELFNVGGIAMDDLYTVLKNKRQELNLSLRDAAELIGISHSYLSTLEKGIDPRNGAPVKPTPDTLQLISNAYNIDYNRLMTIAGYLIENEISKPQLTRRDEREIEKILEQTKKELENAEGLMFSGQPATPEAIQSILDSMRIGMEIAKQRNKEKYTPKKYRKDKKTDNKIQK